MKVSNDDHDTVISRLPGLTYVQMSREAPVKRLVRAQNMDENEGHFRGIGNILGALKPLHRSIVPAT